MCGIVGYIGSKQAEPFLMEGLSKLEYRGYDSAGIAVFNGEKIVVEKSVGRLNALREKIKGHIPQGNIGIGHTRWATHGCPSDVNSHPHVDCHGEFAVVHNGIIENYLELRKELMARGHHFASETDTEVVAHLLEECYQGDFAVAVRAVLKRIRGSYALVFLAKAHPDMLICTKKDNPLVIGIGQGENFIASDIPAIINHSKESYILNDGEMAIVRADGVEFYQTVSGEKFDKEIFTINWSAEAAEKNGYEHFMLKEIHEQPKAIRDTLSGRLDITNNRVVLNELNWSLTDLQNFHRIFIVACGTAYHAGLVGKYYIEKLARIPVEVDIASEFRYRQPIVDEHTLVIVVSQSGETSDTLAALKEMNRLGATTLAITNVVSSSIAREAQKVIYTMAGPEIAVASTKAYTTQLIVVLLLALYLAGLKQTIEPTEMEKILCHLRDLPEKIDMLFAQTETIEKLASHFKDKNDAFFIGRSLDYAVALEGSLKLKEISYIHAEAYAAGELKHGTLALIVPGTPVIALATQRHIHEKTISNIKEVKARQADVLAIVPRDNTSIEQVVDHVFYIPETVDLLAPILTVIPLQLFAYYMAVARGCDVDKPRNLAKSVTVE